MMAQTWLSEENSGDTRRGWSLCASIGTFIANEAYTGVWSLVVMLVSELYAMQESRGVST